MQFLPLNPLLLLLPALAIPAAAEAQERAWSGVVAAGAGARPDYMGSDDLEATPYLAGRIYYGAFYLDFQGEQLRLNVSPIEGWAFGPMMDIESGRKDDVKSVRVGRMAKIDDAFEAGGFIAYSRADILAENDELSFQASYLTDTSNTSDGAVAALGLTYGKRIDKRWTVGGGVKASYVDRNYAQTYFGVSAADAVRSGLPSYNLKAGVRDVGLSAKVGYALTDKWDLQLLGSYKRLMGDFADSPIVKTEGSADQFSAAVAVAYRF